STATAWSSGPRRARDRLAGARRIDAVDRRLTPPLRPVQGRAHRGEEPARGPGLLEEPGDRAPLEATDGLRLAVTAGEEHGDAERRRLELGDHLGAAEAGHRQVEDDEVEAPGIRVESGQRHRPVADELHPVPGLLEHAAGGLAD